MPNLVVVEMLPLELLLLRRDKCLGRNVVDVGRSADGVRVRRAV